MMLLSRYCYENSMFREVVNTQSYKSNFYQEDMEKIYVKRSWNNTNKLLGMGWEGIKTGQTNSAGSCLASVREGVFIVVLNASNREARFDDTVTLWEWYQNS
jgi:D-alanyl-D-alanine carboxypeptidase